MNLIKKFQNKKNIYGNEYAWASIIQFAKSKIGIKDPITKRKIILSKRLDFIFNSTVHYGSFKGLKLSKNTWWGAPDKAAMLLGLYEKEILDSLVQIPKTYNIFIDLGAADGYYGVGVLVAKLFDYSHCFEITESGRRTIKENANNNFVTEKITINGIAESDFYKSIPAEQLAHCVMLVDIEGAEFDIFDDHTFAAFSNSIIIVELHDWQLENGAEKLHKFKELAKQYFAITTLTTTSRDTSSFPELKNFSDDDRWLICSEGRGRQMNWLRLDPKAA